MAAKLLLIEDVLGLGRRGDLVTAKAGYVRNYLVPKKLAVLADHKALGMQARLQQERLQKAVADKKDAELLADKLRGKSVTSFVKVDHDGHMYGSVSAADIARLLEDEHGVVVDRHTIQLKGAIKKTGITSVSLKLPEGIVAEIALKVYPEGFIEPAEEEKAPDA